MVMDIKDLVRDAPDLIGGTWANRLDYAASILYLHGYIPESQRKKIADKMNKQFQDGLAKGDIVPRKEETPNAES